MARSSSWGDWVSSELPSTLLPTMLRIGWMGRIGWDASLEGGTSFLSNTVFHLDPSIKPRVPWGIEPKEPST
eukprot:scaffold241_cov340-Pavlova_lutheri.AAC.38